MSLEAEMLANIRLGVEHHNATCPMPARAILLNSGNFELFGWTELFGLPVEPRDEVPPRRFRIDCPGSAYGIEEEMTENLNLSSNSTSRLSPSFLTTFDSCTCGMNSFMWSKSETTA